MSGEGNLPQGAVDSRKGATERQHAHDNPWKGKKVREKFQP